MPKSRVVNWELGSLRNGLGNLDLRVPADGMPQRSAAPGRGPTVITEVVRSSSGLSQELRGYSDAGELLATAIGPMLCAVCKQPAVDTRLCRECWVRRAWCDTHRVEVLEPCADGWCGWSDAAEDGGE